MSVFAQIILFDNSDIEDNLPLLQVSPKALYVF